MTNPAQTLRMLITYAICIPLAIFMGYVMTEVGNRPDFTNLFIIGAVLTLLLSPIVIRWHYAIMFFSLASPIYCFFLKGNPPLAQVAVILSFAIAIIDRTMNSQHQFKSPAIMVWPLLFTMAMAYTTSQLTGGIGLKTLGGEVGGGKKYIALFIGCLMFFALTSRYIAKEKRNLFVALYFLPGSLQFFSDLFPVLPSPLNYINLFIPPSAGTGDFEFGVTRLGAFAASAGVIANFMLAKYGIRGIFSAAHPLRFLLFGLLMVMTLLGGFRIILISYTMILTMLFFLEGLHRTRFVLVAVLGLVLGGALLVPLADKLPITFQRALSFLPLKLDPIAVSDAEGSKKWRVEMWRDTWPKVPQYLLVGKGYALSAEDFQMMGDGIFANRNLLDKSYTALAISGDYHNGPLSTLMPFGIWGAISFFWVTLAGFFIMYRNYQYGDPELKNVNRFLMVLFIQRFIGFFLIFGAFSNDIGEFAKLAGFSIALNCGICGVKALPAVVQHIRPLNRFRPQPARIA